MKFELKTLINGKICLTELYDSKLSGLSTFDIIISDLKIENKRCEFVRHRSLKLFL